MVASQYDSTPCSNFIYRAIDGCLDVSKLEKRQDKQLVRIITLIQYTRSDVAFRTT